MASAQLDLTKLVDKVETSDPKFLPWEDIDTAARIERLRQIVKNMQNTQNQFDRMLSLLQSMLTQHEHGQTAKPVIPINLSNQSHFCDKESDSLVKCKPWF